MKPFVIALAVGILVGVIYGLLNVRSPAPPYVALVGLLGILLGEHAVDRIRALRAPPPQIARPTDDAPPEIRPDARP